MEFCRSSWGCEFYGFAEISPTLVAAGIQGLCPQRKPIDELTWATIFRVCRSSTFCAGSISFHREFQTVPFLSNHK